MYTISLCDPKRLTLHNGSQESKNSKQVSGLEIVQVSDQVIIALKQVKRSLDLIYPIYSLKTRLGFCCVFTMLAQVTFTCMFNINPTIAG